MCRHQTLTCKCCEGRTKTRYPCEFFVHRRGFPEFEPLPADAPPCLQVRRIGDDTWTCEDCITDLINEGKPGNLILEEEDEVESESSQWDSEPDEPFDGIDWVVID